MKDDAFFKDWEMFIEQTAVGELEEGDMTASMLAARTGKNIVTTTGILRGLFLGGRATRRWVWEDGRKVYAYKVVQELPSVRGSDTSRKILQSAPKRRSAASGV